MSDVHRSLLVGPEVIAAPSCDGPLSGLTFVVKDLFDVVGQRTGAGNPDVLAAAEPATRHAVAVQTLLDAGATCIGKAHTAETAYSLSGVNLHYATPLNPVAADRDPGGSSSGSAVAVAAGLCDFALGSDTAGSTRVPASYCGVIGVRPTHGRISLEGVFPLAPRFDTVGWMARDATIAQVVGQVLLGRLPRREAPPPPEGAAPRAGSARREGLRRLLVATDLFGVCDPGHTEAIQHAVAQVGAALGRPGEPLRFWRRDEQQQWPVAFRTLQRRDAWQANRSWIERLEPTFAPAVGDRWAQAAAETEEARQRAERHAAVLSEQVWELLSGGTVLLVPSAPGPAPPLALDPHQAASVRQRLMALTTISPIARLPEISLPLMTFEGLPVGVGMIASPGSDELLLELAARLVANP